ncbi:MAG: TlyA family RNA methyltransferase [Betaproteobacteria bacterium]|nr:TlyA family RNA methyltransferase [Betaproteobacteria bacterium]
MRADQLIVQQGLAPTRSAAQRLIERGAVRWRATRPSAAAWSVPRKAGDDLPADCVIEVTDDAELRWASRAGLKLQGALDALALDVNGCVALDVGQSTGGFTDVLLARGARRVAGVDVGHGQLAQRLREDPRVAVFEGLNARELRRESLGAECPAAGFDLIVGDLSFISLTLVLPALVPLLSPSGRLLMLVKPQFELQPHQLGKGGVVRDASLHAQVESRIRAACAEAGLAPGHWIESPITGGDGNREFFVCAQAMGCSA